MRLRKSEAMKQPDRKVNIPCGESGDWKVEHFEVTAKEEEFGKLRCMLNSQRPFRFVPAGTYTRLTCNGAVIMSDTPDEIRDLITPICEARKRGGHVLIGGLGLGVLVSAILKEMPRVTAVTAIENSPDVIRLVGNPLRERFPHLRIHEADILTWLPPRGARYTVAFFDIWDAICGDNVAEMTTLKRKYGRRADWKGCWCEHECRRLNGR